MTNTYILHVNVRERYNIIKVSIFFAVKKRKLIIQGTDDLFLVERTSEILAPGLTIY
jgi:hypothetical protein